MNKDILKNLLVCCASYIPTKISPTPTFFSTNYSYLFVQARMAKNPLLDIIIGKIPLTIKSTHPKYPVLSTVIKQLFKDCLINMAF